MKRGQIATEFLFVIGIIFFIFLIIVFFTIRSDINVNNLIKNANDKKECLKISRSIDEIYFNKGSIRFKVKSNFTIDANEIYVGNEFCDFFALNYSSGSFNEGNIFLEYNSGVVIRNE